MRPPLHETHEQRVQHVGSVTHQLNIGLCRVDTLPVLYRPFEHVAEFGFRAEIVRPDEVDHAPILHEVVLEGVAGQDHAAFRAHLL